MSDEHTLHIAHITISYPVPKDEGLNSLYRGKWGKISK